MSTTTGDHDRPLVITVFNDYAAAAKTEKAFDLGKLAEHIATTNAGRKDQLPWLKMARFGDIRTDKFSLRHDGNVNCITGIEADYDAEVITFDEAVEVLTKAGVLALAYTSPSHTEDRQRWRILCPLGENYPPDRRSAFMGRLNGLFGGIFSAESWALSQSYYFGSVNHNPSHRVELIDGTPIDEHDELDEIWTPKPNTRPSNGSAGSQRQGPVDEDGLLEEITTGASYHAASLRLLGKWARNGMSFMDARARIIADFETVFPPDRDARWESRRDDVDRSLDHVFGKEAQKRDTAGEAPPASSAKQPSWGIPDMTVLRLGRRAPPTMPLDVFGPTWASWIEAAAKAAAGPPDYVAAPLLASASALIGHARWAQATPGWKEPPHLWVGTVGDSGSSKSPGSDCLLRDVLPVIEQRMVGDFPDKLREWRAAAEAVLAAQEQWKADVRTAQKSGHAPPMPPPETAPAEPQSPRLRQADITVEKVASLLATAAPKGLLITRDELSGWLLGLNSYNDAGRAFWIEAYGGRPYRVERQKNPEPIVVPRLAVAVTGGTQPEKLASMFREADDGLLSRFVWAWPDPEPFFLGRVAPDADWAIEALDRLRVLDLAPSEQPPDPARPVMVPLSLRAVQKMEGFGQDMQRRQQEAGGLMRSAWGKARGLALRLSLALEMLRWCGRQGFASPPTEIGEEAFDAACRLVADYFMPMAERVYGDAAATVAERNAATLARWIVRDKATEVYVRRLQREVRLPGLNTADLIHGAAAVLVEAGWLIAPKIGFGSASRAAYPVNPAVLAETLA